MDERQVTKLATQYGASLVLYARQWSRDPDDAVQDALIDMLNLSASPNDPAAWLFTAVKRKALNQARSETRRRKHNESLSAQRDNWFAPKRGQTIDAEGVCEQLLHLPDVDREIVVAKIWGELNFEQIAEVVGQSRSAVHRRYQSALKKLAATHQYNESNPINTRQVVR